MDVIEGHTVRLRPAADDDLDRLVAIRATPEVHRRWGGKDLPSEVGRDLADVELHQLAIEDATGAVVGLIQWEEEDDPDYRHASIDIYLDPSVHGRGLGTDAVAALAHHLVGSAATTGSPSIRPRTTVRPSAATRRSGFAPSGSCAATSEVPTAPGTTVC